MKFGKKAAAFEWFMGLFILFFLGVVFIVFNNALTEHIKPIPGQLIDDDFQNKSEIIQQNDEWFEYWQLIPIIIFVLVILLIFVKSLTEQTDTFG